MTKLSKTITNNITYPSRIINGKYFTNAIDCSNFLEYGESLPCVSHAFSQLRKRL